MDAGRTLGPAEAGVDGSTDPSTGSSPDSTDPAMPFLSVSGTTLGKCCRPRIPRGNRCCRVERIYVSGHGVIGDGRCAAMCFAIADVRWRWPSLGLFGDQLGWRLWRVGVLWGRHTAVSTISVHTVNHLMGTRRKCLSVWPPYQLVTACQYPASENYVSPNKRVDRSIRVRTITVSPP